jgi:hypothetical protein
VTQLPSGDGNQTIVAVTCLNDQAVLVCVSPVPQPVSDSNGTLIDPNGQVAPATTITEFNITDYSTHAYISAMTTGPLTNPSVLCVMVGN